jgi:hypothetical protein
MPGAERGDQSFDGGRTRSNGEERPPADSVPPPDPARPAGCGWAACAGRTRGRAGRRPPGTPYDRMYRQLPLVRPHPDHIADRGADGPAHPPRSSQACEPPCRGRPPFGHGACGHDRPSRLHNPNQAPPTRDHRRPRGIGFGDAGHSRRWQPTSYRLDVGGQEITLDTTGTEKLYDGFPEDGVVL